MLPKGLPYLTIFVVSVIARLWVIFSGGGLRGSFPYDSAVYYTAGDALSHGLVPYHGDFVLLHPPLIAAVGVPFAVLGRLTSDWVGFAAENLAFCVLGGVNAVLVMLVGRRFSIPAHAAFAGGLFYAVWVASAGPESSIRLETLGNAFLLVSLLAMSAALRSDSWRSPVLMGCFLGCLVNVKIWWAVPVGIIAIWYATTTRSLRRAGLVVAGFVAACLVIDLPIFVVAGHRMFRSIVSAQLGRVDQRVSISERLRLITSANQVATRSFTSSRIESSAGVWTATCVVCVLFALACIAASRSWIGRLVATVAVSQFVILLYAPAFYSFYTDYLAVALSLTIAAAAAPAGAWFGRRTTAIHSGFGVAMWVAAGTATVATFAGGHLVEGASIPGRQALAASMENAKCVVSDSPMGLIEVDALDRSFARGCRNWVDVTGVRHGGGPDPRVITSGNRPAIRWRQALGAYLTSGDAVVIVTPRNLLVVTPEYRARIERHGVLARAGSQVAYCLRRCRR